MYVYTFMHTHFLLLPCVSCTTWLALCSVWQAKIKLIVSFVARPFSLWPFSLASVHISPQYRWITYSIFVIFGAAQREGEKVCVGCDDQVYCGRCWTMEHKDEDMAAHLWKGADSGKCSSPSSSSSSFPSPFLLRACRMYAPQERRILVLRLQLMSSAV